MQIIIIGCGKIGSSLARELIQREEDIIIVERDEELLEMAADIDCQKINGIPIDQEVLREAGIATADVVCAVTPDDNVNIMATQIAKLVYNVPKVITRLYNPLKKQVFQDFGLDTFCSTDLTVKEIMRDIDGEVVSYKHNFYDSNLVYSTLAVEAELLGERMGDLTGQADQIVIGVLRDQSFILNQADLVIEEGDQFVLLSKN